MNSDGHRTSPPTPPPAPAPKLPPSQKTVDPSSSKLTAEIPSACDTSFESTLTDCLCGGVEPKSDKPYNLKPVYYFFYGTLVDPKILSHILDLKQLPVLRPAKLVGYESANWGQYRALIAGEPGAEVTGYAYLVESIDDELKLARYETNAYEPARCLIRFMDGMTPAQETGKTFKYAGDAQALKAGRFDRKLWESQMGMRLPDQWGTRDAPSEE